MKISEFQNEDALDLLADLIDPVSNILADDEVIKSLNTNKISMVKTIIKTHKKEVIEILARLDGVPVEEYKVNVFTLPIKLIEILNDEGLVNFFDSQQVQPEKTSSGLAMVNTEETETI